MAVAVDDNVTIIEQPVLAVVQGMWIEGTAFLKMQSLSPRRPTQAVLEYLVLAVSHFAEIHHHPLLF